MTWGKSPGFAAYWSLRKGLFTPAFQSLCDAWPESPEVFTGGVMAALSEGPIGAKDYDELP